ncbi:unnamed protein product [Fusarium graminearum]|nr:unnamed protein product [Fusarium graminearum]CAG2010003.1 unnamed protein product [Fusarium graminearum]
MALPTSAGGKGPVLMLLLALAYCYDTYGYCRCCHEQGEGACSSKEEEKLESAEWVFPAKVGLASTKIAVGMERYCANKSGGRPCGLFGPSCADHDPWLAARLHWRSSLRRLCGGDHGAP